MKKRLIIIISSVLICLSLFATTIYAYFHTSNSGYKQEIRVGTIVLSLNDNSDVRTIKSFDAKLRHPGDIYDFELKVDNFGVTIFSYELDFSFLESSDLINACEVYISNDSENYSYICMLDELPSHDEFSGVLAPNQQRLYYMRLRLSPGAGSYYDNLSFTMDINATSFMILEDYYEGSYYVSSTSGLDFVSKSDTYKNYQIVLLSDIILNSDITFNSYTLIDLNGKKLDLNGYSIIVNDTSNNNSTITDSYTGGTIVSSNGGSLTFNLQNSIALITDSLKDNTLINVENISDTVLINTISSFIESAYNSHFTTEFEMFNNLEIYLYKGIYKVIFNEESIYSEANQAGYITYSASDGLSLVQHEYTLNALIDFDFYKGSSKLINKSFYITIIGSGVQSLAQEALANLPSVITSSLFLNTYDANYNAYYTWYSSNEDLFDSNGVFLRNGYTNLPSYENQAITIGVRVEQNGTQSILYEKEITVEILDAQQRSELLYEKYEGDIVLNKIGEEYTFAFDTSLFEKTGFIGANLSIGDNNINVDEPFIEVSGSTITTLSKSKIDSENIVTLYVDFSYNDLIQYRMTLNVVVIGFLQNVQIVDIKDELNSYLPTTDVYEDFTLLNKTTQGVGVTFYSKYPNLYSIKYNNLGIPYVHFIVNNFPSTKAEISLGCITDSDVEIEDLNFEITGIIHNNSEGIQDETLFKAILSACEDAYDSTDTTHGYKKDRWLTSYELANPKVTTIEIEGVADLSGIQFLTNLEFIKIKNGNIQDISVLSSLKKLTILNLNNNAITNISALEYMDSLSDLSLVKNKISDISPLRNLYSLTKLDISENAVISFEPLLKLNNLVQLDVSKQNYTGSVLAASQTDLYYLFKLYDSNQYNTKIVYSTSDSSTATVKTNEDATYATQIVASRVLSYVSDLTTIQNSLNLVDTFYYNSEQYDIKFSSSDDTILSIYDDNSYEFHSSNIIIDTTINLLVSVKKHSDLTYVTISKPITVLVKPASDVDTIYIETAPGVYQEALIAIPDKNLLKALYQSFNTADNEEITFTLSGNVVTTTGKYVLTQSEIAGTDLVDRTLAYSGYNIKDLTGIEYFKSSIIGLDLRYSSITVGFEKLNLLTKLQTLRLNNYEYDFSKLSGLTSLTSLYVLGCYNLDSLETLGDLFTILMNNYANSGFKIYKDSEKTSWNPLGEELDKLIQQLQDLYVFRDINDTETIATNNGSFSFELYGYTFTYSVTFSNYLDPGSGYVGGNGTKYKTYLTTSTSGNTKTVTLKCLSALDILFYDQVKIQLTGTNKNVYTSTVTKEITYKIEKNVLNKILLSDGLFYSFEDIFGNDGLRQYAMTCLNGHFRTDSETGILYVTEEDMLTYIVNTSANKNTSSTNVLTFDGSSSGESAMKGLHYTGITVVRFLRISKLDGDECVNLTTLVLRYGCVILSELVTNALVRSNKLTKLTIEYTIFLDPWVYENGVKVANKCALTDLLSITTLSIINDTDWYDFTFIKYLALGITTINLYSSGGALYTSTKDALITYYNRCVEELDTYSTTYKYYLESATIAWTVDSNDSKNEDTTEEKAFDSLKGMIEDIGIITSTSNTINESNSSLLINTNRMISSTEGLYLPLSMELFNPNYTGDYAVNHTLKPVISYRIQTNTDISCNGNSVVDLLNYQTVEYNGITYLVPTINHLEFDVVIALIATVTATESSTSSRVFIYYVVIKGSANTSVDSNGMEYVNVSKTSISNPNREISVSGKIYSYNNFVDLELRNYICDVSLSKNYLGVLTEEFTTSSLTFSYTGKDIDASNTNVPRRISSLEGLQMFTNVSSITFSKNQITDLSPLLNLSSSLVTLDLNLGAISDISILKNFTNLTTLNLANCFVTKLKDESGNCYLPVSLTSLNLSNNSILASEIESLKNHINLTTLNIYNTTETQSIEIYYALKELVSNMYSDSSLRGTSIYIHIMNAYSSGYSVSAYYAKIIYIINTYENTLSLRDDQIIRRYGTYNDSKTINYDAAYEASGLSSGFSGSFVLAYSDQNISTNGTVSSSLSTGENEVLTTITFAPNFIVPFKTYFILSETRTNYSITLADGEVIEINSKNFPDTNFREYLIKTLLGVNSNPADNVFTFANLESFKYYFQILSVGIEDLTGIKYLPVIQLVIDGNKFESLPELPKTITSLTISNNSYLKDITNIYNLTSLTTLDLWTGLYINYMNSGTYTINSTTYTKPYWEIIADLMNNNTAFKNLKLNNIACPQLVQDYNPKSTIFSNMGYESTITLESMGNSSYFFIGRKDMEYEVLSPYTNSLNYGFDTYTAARLFRFALNNLSMSTSGYGFQSMVYTATNVSNIQTVKYDTNYYLPKTLSYMGATFNIIYNYQINGTGSTITLDKDSTNDYYCLNFAANSGVNNIVLTPRVTTASYNGYTYTVNANAASVTCTYGVVESVNTKIMENCYIVSGENAYLMTDEFDDYNVIYTIMNNTNVNTVRSGVNNSYYVDGVKTDIDNKYLLDLTEIAGIKSLDLTNVVSLKGFRYFTALTSLRFTGYVTDLSELEYIPQLTYFSITFAGFSGTAFLYSSVLDLNQLKPLKDTLTSLTINYTTLHLSGTVNLAPILGFKKLTNLTLSQDALTYSFDYSLLKEFITLQGKELTFTSANYEAYKSLSGAIVLERYLESYNLIDLSKFELGDGGVLNLSDTFDNAGTEYEIIIKSASKSVNVTKENDQYIISSDLSATYNDIIIIIVIDGFYYQRTIELI